MAVNKSLSKKLLRKLDQGDKLGGLYGGASPSVGPVFFGCALATVQGHHHHPPGP